MDYLDHAATSFPKDASVSSAISEYIAECGNPGRGGHVLAARAEDTVWSTRQALADLLNVSSAEQVVFSRLGPVPGNPDVGRDQLGRLRRRHRRAAGLDRRPRGGRGRVISGVDRACAPHGG